MALPVAVVISFVWTYVIPILRDCVKVLNKGIYAFIKDRVDDADIVEAKGMEKRIMVYESAQEYLEGKKFDTSIYSSSLIYLLIEIAVANLRKKQKRLMKNQ